MRYKSILVFRRIFSPFQKIFQYFCSTAKLLLTPSPTTKNLFQGDKKFSWTGTISSNFSVLLEAKLPDSEASPHQNSSLLSETVTSFCSGQNQTKLSPFHALPVVHLHLCPLVIPSRSAVKLASREGRVRYVSKTYCRCEVCPADFLEVLEF